jgi:hypothetical protein
VALEETQRAFVAKLSPSFPMQFNSLIESNHRLLEFAGRRQRLLARYLLVGFRRFEGSFLVIMLLAVDRRSCDADRGRREAIAIADDNEMKAMLDTAGRGHQALQGGGRVRVAQRQRLAVLPREQEPPASWPRVRARGGAGMLQNCEVVLSDEARVQLRSKLAGTPADPASEVILGRLDSICVILPDRPTSQTFKWGWRYGLAKVGFEYKDVEREPLFRVRDEPAGRHLPVLRVQPDRGAARGVSSRRRAAPEIVSRQDLIDYTHSHALALAALPEVVDGLLRAR